MPGFISDDEMAKMESAPAPKAGFISDEEMGKLEAPPARDAAPGPTMGPTAPPEPTGQGGLISRMMDKGISDGYKSYSDDLSAETAWRDENGIGRPEAQSMTVTDNPVLTASSPAGNAMTGAVGAMAAPIGKAAMGLGERLATSPVPKTIADATNVTGKAKGLFKAATDIFTETLPESGKKIADAVTGAAGRFGAYHSPLAPVQAVSDTARAAQVVQTGVAKLLDTAPEALGRFAPVLKAAAARGGSALATTDFLLSKTDPEYQEMKKKAQEQ